MQWDVIIVGAGPAGSALACRLRPHLRVLVLERGVGSASASASAPSPTLPRIGPRIGESLPGAARVLLQRFGVFERFLHDKHAERGATISQWHADASVWFDHLRDPHGSGWHLDRAQFDTTFRRAASEAGAKVIEDCSMVRVTRLEGIWQVAFEARSSATPHRQTHCAPVVVDASGRSAAVARQFGVTLRTDDDLICLYCHLDADDDDDDQCTRLCAARDGWWYSARLPSGQRVLAYHLDKDDAQHKTLRDPRALLAKAREIPLLASVLALHAADLTQLHVHARPAGSALLDLDALNNLAPGIFAVGDAVIAFDPISSQGIFHALASAESAARAITAQHAGEATSYRLYRDEMQAVYARYRLQLQATYAQVQRFQDEPFWQRRSASAV